MALNPTQLGLALANTSNPLGPSPTEITHWTAIANAIISHFITNAVISTTDTVNVVLPPEGVATIISSPVGGPCTGTGTGTGSGSGTGTIS